MDSINDKPRADFQTCIETQLLIERMMTLEPEETITYEELSEVVGFDIRTKRSLVYSAIRIMRRDESRLFVCVKTKGYMRCSWKSSLDKGDQRHHRQMNINREAEKDTVCIDYHACDNEGKVRLNVQRSRIGVIKLFGSRKVNAKLVDAVQKADSALPAAKAIEGTLALFSKKKGSDGP